MKVADLIDDLERGDRSMEHLKTEPAREVNSLVHAASGLFGYGLGQMNHFANQQMMGMQNTIGGYAMYTAAPPIKGGF